MQLFDKRPKYTEERLPREVRVYDLLDSLGIEWMIDRSRYKADILEMERNIIICQTLLPMMM